MLFHIFIHPDHPVSAELLRIIQHGVRHLQIETVIISRLGNHRHTPDTDRDPLGHGRVMGNVQILHYLADFLQMSERLVRIVAHEKRHELLAPITGKKVRTALQMRRHLLRHGNQHLVTGRMPERVVIYLETVNVEKANGCLLYTSDAADDLIV